MPPAHQQQRRPVLVLVLVLLLMLMLTWMRRSTCQNWTEVTPTRTPPDQILVHFHAFARGELRVAWCGAMWCVMQCVVTRGTTR